MSIIESAAAAAAIPPAVAMSANPAAAAAVAPADASYVPRTTTPADSGLTLQQTDNWMVRLIDQINLLLQELEEMSKGETRDRRPPTVEEGHLVGLIDRPGHGSTRVHIEDVIGASSSERDALKLARQYSEQHGGEAVAIVKTIEPTGFRDRLVGAATQSTVGGAADAAAAMKIPSSTKVTYNVVTLDPAIPPRNADMLSDHGFIKGGGYKGLSHGRPSIEWIVDDRDAARVGNEGTTNGVPLPPDGPPPGPPVYPGLPGPPGPPPGAPQPITRPEFLTDPALLTQHLTEMLREVSELTSSNDGRPF